MEAPKTTQTKQKVVPLSPKFFPYYLIASLLVYYLWMDMISLLVIRLRNV